MMSGFNWDAYGPDAHDTGVPSHDESAEQQRPTNGSWDFILGGDDTGLSTEAMNSQIEDFLSAAQQAQTDAASVTSDAWDSDNLVHITVNSAGVVIATEFDTDALRRSSTRSLAAAITEAAQSAASRARAAVEEQLAPLLGGIDQIDGTIPDDSGTPNVNALFEDARAMQRRLYDKPEAHHPADPRASTRGSNHDR